MPEQGGKDRPRTLLLATDLTPACDRACDRAVQLARQWGAHLTVVHVVETGDREVIGVSRRTSSASSEMARLLETVRAQDNLQISHHLSFGKAAEALLSLAREMKCYLLITGLAHAKSLGEKFIGSTVEHLVREAQVPVLSVRRRAFSHTNPSPSASISRSLQGMRWIAPWDCFPTASSRPCTPTISASSAWSARTRP